MFAPVVGAVAPMWLLFAARAITKDYFVLYRVAQFAHGVVATHMNKVIIKPKSARKIKDV